MRVCKWGLTSLVAQMVKHLPTMWETQVQSLGWEDPWRREWQPTPVFLPGESNRQRSLVGYSPRGCKESDTTERLHSLTHSILFWLKYHLCQKVREGRMGAPGSLSTGSSPKSPRHTFGEEPLNTCREQLTSSLSNFSPILVEIGRAHV